MVLIDNMLDKLNDPKNIEWEAPRKQAMNMAILLIQILTSIDIKLTKEYRAEIEGVVCKAIEVEPKLLKDALEHEEWESLEAIADQSINRMYD
jgi:hypothetical protein